MPTIQPIAEAIIPKETLKPIPVRVVSTRPDKPKVAAAQTADPQFGNQTSTSVSNPAAASATTAESVKLPPETSALARKEQAFRQREAALKQKEQEFEARFAKVDKATQFDELKAKIAAKDFSEAEKLGLNYEDYVKYKLDQTTSDDPNVQAIKKLEAEIAALKKGQEDSAQQEFESTKTAYKKEILAAVATNPDFSSIKELKAEEHVLQLILDSFEEDGLEMTVAEACKDIEDALVENGKKFSELTKLKPKPATEEPRKLPPPKPSVNTLTNQMQSTGAGQTIDRPLSELPDHERYAEARRRVEARRAKEQGS
jgi:hypothetical protein